jgi:hypothetical protein
MSLKLLKQNPHLHDKHLFFDEAPHIYYIDGKSDCIISTTTFIHCYFETFDPVKISNRIVKSRNYMNGKYAGMNPFEIQNKWSTEAHKASTEATITHRRIELFYNDVRELFINKKTKQTYTLDDLGAMEVAENKYKYNTKLVPRYSYKKLKDGNIINIKTGLSETDIEYSYFLKFYFDHRHLTPFRTEWEIYDPELRIAGSIDMIFRRDDGQLELGDWKRTKQITKVNNFSKGMSVLSHLPSANFWQYSLQLNIYRTILEKYYGQKIAKMYLIWLNKNNPSYVKFVIPRMDHEVQAIFADRRKNVDLDKEKYHEYVEITHKEQHRQNNINNYNSNLRNIKNGSYTIKTAEQLTNEMYHKQVDQHITNHYSTGEEDQTEIEEYGTKIPDKCCF